jgi:phytoene synthase
MERQEDEGQAGETSVVEAARAFDRDRYLAALLAPKRVQSDLLALAAFHGEIARIPLAVSEPGVGDIRLQWWRDALRLPPDVATGNPVADAFRQTQRDHTLSLELCDGLIDAYALELDAGALGGPNAAAAHAEATQGAVFQLAAGVVGVSAVQAAPLLAAAGISYGHVQLLRALPLLVAKGRNPFGDADLASLVASLTATARVHLGKARQLATSAPAAILPVILPLALVEPYLAALEGLDSRVASERADISPVTRSWRLLKASTLGRV